jgi:hypothetical protein
MKIQVYSHKLIVLIDRAYSRHVKQYLEGRRGEMCKRRAGVFPALLGRIEPSSSYCISSPSSSTLNSTRSLPVEFVLVLISSLRARTKSLHVQHPAYSLAYSSFSINKYYNKLNKLPSKRKK